MTFDRDATMCAEPQPWNKRVCVRPLNHDGPHESWLTPRETILRWSSPVGPVKYHRAADQSERRHFPRLP